MSLLKSKLENPCSALGGLKLRNGIGINITYHQYKGKSREIWKKIQEVFKETCPYSTRKLWTQKRTKKNDQKVITQKASCSLINWKHDFFFFHCCHTFLKNTPFPSNFPIHLHISPTLDTFKVQRDRVLGHHVWTAFAKKGWTRWSLRSLPTWYSMIQRFAVYALD